MLSGFLGCLPDRLKSSTSAPNSMCVDGSKFKAVNHRDRNFTSGKMKLRMELIEQSINKYLEQLD